MIPPVADIVAFSPDGALLAAGDHGEILIFDLKHEH
jgi:hypothetical protein